MAGTRSNPQLTTHSSLVCASGLPSSCAGWKCAMSAVDNAANKKLKPAPEIEQELSEEEDQGGVRKKGKGKQRAKAPRQTRKTTGEKKTKGKGGKWGARCTAADKALEEAMAVIPTRLPRMEQALLEGLHSPWSTCRSTRTLPGLSVDSHGVYMESM
ncbi:hypothetical protein DXG01_012469 [Tephrocybe rancida]|nr:hypothetical protein DXG01_012469 [Tephrocybe rancida]